MAENDTDSRGYPYVSQNVWSELRMRFQKSVPAKVTPSYLQSALGFNTEKAAKNLLPQLRTIGLIDADGSPTDLAKRYRIDAEYKDAAQEILQAVYPDELRDLYPGPEEDVNAVANWFMRDTGGGQATATMQARFYLSLASGKPPSAEPKPAPKAGAQTAPRSQKKAKASGAAKPKPQVETESASPGQPPPPAQKGGGPNLHIDVQVHISADASNEQIDAVFASMAKHLYGNG